MIDEKKLKERLMQSVEFAKKDGRYNDQPSWNYQQGVLLDYKEAEYICSLLDVVQTKPEKVCKLIRQKFDDWVFGLETQAGEKLKVVDSSDFNDIITEIENELIIQRP